MELEITHKKDNPLMNRMEIDFKAAHANEPTPRRDEIKTKIAEQLKVPKECVIIDHTNSEYGLNISLGYAKIYKTKDEAIKSERKPILVRNSLAKKEEKGKAAPAVTPAEAAKPKK